MSLDGVCRFWDIKTGNLQKQIKDCYSDRIQFTRDGCLLLSHRGDGRLRLSLTDDCDDKRPRFRLNKSSRKTQDVFQTEAAVFASALSMHGTLLAYVTSNNTLAIRDIKKKRNLFALSLPLFKGEVIAHVTFNMDASTLAIGSIHSGAIIGNPCIRIVDIASGAITNSFGVESRSIVSMQFSPTGDSLATMGPSGVVRIWNIKSGKATSTLQNRNDRFTTMTYSGKGETLLIGTEKGFINRWIIGKDKPAQKVQAHADTVESLSVSAGGDRVASAGKDGRICVLNYPALKPIIPWIGHKHSITCIAYSECGCFVATGSMDSSIRLWHSSGKEIRTIKGHGSRINGVRFVGSGQKLVSASEDGTIKTWSIATGKMLQCIDCSGVAGTILSSGRDEDIVSYSKRGKFRITCWNRESGKVKTTFTIDGVTCPCAADKGDISDDVFTLHYDGIRAFSMASGKGRMVYPIYGGGGSGLTIARNNLYGAFCDATGDIVMFDTIKGEVFRRFECAGIARAQALQFNNNGQMLVSGHVDGSVRIWEIMSGRLRRKACFHGNVVSCVAFSPRESEGIASGSADCSVVLWKHNALGRREILGNRLPKKMAIEDQDRKRWEMLGRSSQKSYVSMNYLAKNRRMALRIIGKRLEMAVVRSGMEKHIGTLIDELDNDDVEKRVSSFRELNMIGGPIVPMLRRRMEMASAEQKQSMNRLLSLVDKEVPNNEVLQLSRAVEVLGRIDCREAWKLLDRIGPRLPYPISVQAKNAKGAK
jgi:WD40 repeat protein